MASYGRSLGVAFQIADDLLDLVGEEQTAGKSLGTDLDQQKLTLPVIHLLATAPADVAARARAQLQGSGAARRVTLVRELEAAGALAYARRRAEAFAARAAADLDCLPPSECRSILEALPERVVYRNA
jgi:octaprenyl-diphosphate synthase